MIKKHIATTVPVSTSMGWWKQLLILVKLIQKERIILEN
jgi:hypothetical protein